MIEDTQEIMKAGVNILMDTVLNLIQNDPHQWSNRPCSTCKSISSIIGNPFGCYVYAINKKVRELRIKELSS